MLGRFKTEKQAALAYDRAPLYNNPEVAGERLNFPKQRSRLKPASPAELRAEARREYKETTQSRFRGVSQFRDKWAASIDKRGRGHHLGTFEVEEHAAAAYDRAAKKLYGARAMFNFHPETGEELCGKPLPAASTKTAQRARAGEVAGS
jgi:hypothetical protein